MRGENIPTKLSVCKRLFRSVFLAAATVAGLFTAAGAQPFNAEANPRTLRAVILYDAPPAYFRNEKTGRAAGFAVDILDGIAKRAGFGVAYTFERNVSAMIDKVLSGEADLAPMLAVSDERKKNLLFSETIDSQPISVFVRAQNNSITGLRSGLTVGTIKGSFTYEQISGIKGLNLKIYAGLSEGLFDFLAGRIDAFAISAPTFLRLARQAGIEDKIKIVGAPIAESKGAIAVRKDNVLLHARLNKALEGFIGSPEYRSIYVKWYGKPRHFWAKRRIIWVSAAVILMTVCGMAAWRYKSVLKLNRELTANILERRKTAALLQEARGELETRVKERTAELQDVNIRLQNQIDEGHRMGQDLVRLSGVILTAQEEERKRLARELHDGLGQSLLAMKLKLQKFAADTKKGVSAVPEACSVIISDVSALVEELRNITMDLRPSFLEERDLCDIFHWYGGRFQETSGIRIDIDSEPGIDADLRIKENLYRIFQEALNNVSKHSGADTVKVRLRNDGKRLSLTIKDNGKGFDPTGQHIKEKGFGLTTMRERLELLNGTLHIDSLPEGGTSIVMELPTV